MRQAKNHQVLEADLLAKGKRSLEQMAQAADEPAVNVGKTWITPDQQPSLRDDLNAEKRATTELGLHPPKRPRTDAPGPQSRDKTVKQPEVATKKSLLSDAQVRNELARTEAITGQALDPSTKALMKAFEDGRISLRKPTTKAKKLYGDVVAFLDVSRNLDEQKLAKYIDFKRQGRDSEEWKRLFGVPGFNHVYLEMSAMLNLARHFRKVEAESLAQILEDIARTEWQTRPQDDEGGILGTTPLFEKLVKDYPMLEDREEFLVGGEKLTLMRQHILANNVRVEKLEDGRFLYQISKDHFPPKYIEMRAPELLGKIPLTELDDKHAKTEWGKADWLDEHGKAWQSNLVLQLSAFSNMQIIIEQKYNSGEPDYWETIKTLGKLSKLNQFNAEWKNRYRMYQHVVVNGKLVYIKALPNNRAEVDAMTLHGPWYDEDRNLLPGEGINTTIEREIRAFRATENETFQECYKWTGEPFPRAIYDLVSAVCSATYDATPIKFGAEIIWLTVYDKKLGNQEKKLIPVPKLCVSPGEFGQGYVCVQTFWIKELNIRAAQLREFRREVSKGHFVDKNGEPSQFADVARLLAAGLDRTLRCYPQDKVQNTIAEQDSESSEESSTD